MVPKEKAQETANWLKAKLVYTTISNSILAGALACSNSNGILLPKLIRKEELSIIQSLFDGTIKIMETKKTAYGNLVLANDKGAVVDPSFSKSEKKQISNTLGVEAIPGEIAGLPYVGSLAVTTNKGTLAHPGIKDKEKDLLEDVLKVPVEKGTVNCGIPYIGTGLIANSRAGVVGSLTTGPEMFIIENAIDVVQDDE
jgi:translation initiation factor 6